MRKCFIPFILVLFAQASFSQSWIDMMKDPSVNFYDVQREFGKSMHRYEKALRKSKSVKNEGMEEMKMPGYMQYKRWEWFNATRVGPDGDRSVISKGMANASHLWHSSHTNRLMQSGNWTLLGPVSAIPTSGGAGRVSCITFHPTDPNTIFVGAASGGLWKSTNGGSTWSTNTDNLPVLSIADIAIDYTDPNIMYIATGDVDGGDNYSVGVLKSMDGGATWNMTSLNSFINQGFQMGRVLIHPVDPNIIFAGTTSGVYRSVDAGTSWVRVSGSTTSDMEFKPGNPNVIYAAGNAIYRSVDGGKSFVNITTGLPSTGVSRYAISVTPADTNYVYVLAGKSSDNGFLGLYRSDDGGATFTRRSNSPNVLGWQNDGSDAGGQAWYDLGFAASPTNKGEIVVGGVNAWRSVDGGTTWKINAHWQGSGAPYVHADVHAIKYYNATTVFLCSDGGVFKTSNNGSTWSDISNGLQIAQMYRLGCSATNPNVVYQGWQDNGTNRWNAGAWSRPLGGDGMECFVDWSSTTYVYGELQNGGLRRSSNSGTNWSSITSGITETAQAAWLTPWCMDPKDSVTIYAGFTNVWKSTNRGSAWTKISTMNLGVQSLAVAPSDPNYIYAANLSTIYKTTNGGTTWTNISAGLPTGGKSITYIAVSGQDPNRIWISLGGYTLNKVFRSINGGATWTNSSYDLPNLPVNCVAVDTTSPLEGVFVGTDLGVYYIDSTRTTWLPLNNGLPNVIVNELEIQYSAKKLRAATYGRGLWETGLFDPTSLAPAANFKGDDVLGCPGMTVQFSDMSSNNPTSWNWTFPNGIPSTSTQQNPAVTYTAAGTYNDVKLIAANASGSDSITKYSYVGVSPAVKPTTNPAGSVTVCAANVIITPGFGATYKWLPSGSTLGVLNVTSNGTFQVIVTDKFGCADTSDPVTITLLPVAATPTVTANGDTLTSSPAFSYQWYTGSSTAVPGATTQTFVGTHGSPYFVVISNADGCTKASATIGTSVAEHEIPGVDVSINPSINNGSFALDIFLKEERSLTAEVLDVTGRVIYSRSLPGMKGRVKENFSLQLSPGIYFISLRDKEDGSVRKFVVE